MKRSIVFSILLIAVLGLTGCMKRDCCCDPDPKLTKTPVVMFQYEYYNYAWGFRHNGFLIDGSGNIKGFRQPEKWITPDSSGLMTSADLTYNLAQCDTTCGKLSKVEIDR